MIRIAEGNLIEAPVEALVNTVNTVGVMGKGIALMFKEAFPENFREYSAAAKRSEVEIGRMFVTERASLAGGPRWIINFPTKQHWKGNSKVQWIEAGLEDLRRVITERGIRSIAVPPLGCGNGGLDWEDVRPRIEAALGALEGVEVLLFPPAREYRNVAKKAGVEALTPARALVAELVRRYWVLGNPCTILEIQKLAWFLKRQVDAMALDDPLRLNFAANRYGPYSDQLRHLLDSLDGSYLHSEVRLADAKPSHVVAFDDSRRDRVELYIRTEAKQYVPALDRTAELIDGFESPLGMELLATVDWLLAREERRPELQDVKEGLRVWPGGSDAGARKLKIFDDRSLELALERLNATLTLA